MLNPAGRPVLTPASRKSLHRKSRPSVRFRSCVDFATAPDCVILWARLGGFRLGMSGDRSNHTISRGGKTRTLAPLALLFALALGSSPAVAHHSGAMFDMAHQVTLTGLVTKVEWTNPHAFMYVDVKNDKGAVEEWAVEVNSPNFLRHNGWTSSTVSPGDTITVTGAPAKTGARFMHGMLVELSNGVQLRS